MSMGIHVIKMPDLGEGIAEVEVVAWRVQPGDEVAEDQVLADVMTDKATVEIPSPVQGTVLALGGAVGASLPVGAELIRLEVEGAGNSRADKPVPARQPAAEAKPQAVIATVSTEIAAKPGPAAPAAAKASPTRPAMASASVLRPAGEKPLASPAVRQRAWDLGIELQYVAGSGPAGRITHADLDAHMAGGQRGGHAGAADRRYAELRGEQAMPLIGLRRKIAERMQEAKRHIPHFTYVEEVDMTELDALRTQLNDRYGDERPRLTLLPLLMRAIVLSVHKFPEVNARFDD